MKSNEDDVFKLVPKLGHSDRANIFMGLKSVEKTFLSSKPVSKLSFLNDITDWSCVAVLNKKDKNRILRNCKHSWKIDAKIIGDVKRFMK